MGPWGVGLELERGALARARQKLNFASISLTAGRRLAAGGDVPATARQQGDRENRVRPGSK